MLCRNLFFLKSNQYSRSVSDRSWYIFVCCISLFAIKFTPHFSLRKFLGKRRFPQILKLPFFPVFTILSATFVLYFQTTYYRPVAGGSNGTPAALPRGQTGPPNPRLPTQQRQRRLRPDTNSGNAVRFLNVSQNFCSKPGRSGGNEIHHSGASSIR